MVKKFVPIREIRVYFSTLTSASSEVLLKSEHQAASHPVVPDEQSEASDASFTHMSEPTKGPVKSVRTDKFVMPLIPEELRIDPRTLAILQCISFLELSGDETVDPDWALEAMEHMAYYLKRLSPDDVARMNMEMQTIASWAESHHLSPQFIDLVRNFLEYIGLDGLSSE